ncbi:hypothetical protein ACFFX0_09225 [Citricoccus parietis]|uniref:Uncharacterized protein n=1 Tax=Citricoccus parietis TaxID=592307 RepID=A0ABV5FXE6_9MICC
MPTVPNATRPRRPNRALWLGGRPRSPDVPRTCLRGDGGATPAGDPGSRPTAPHPIRPTRRSHPRGRRWWRLPACHPRAGTRPRDRPAARQAPSPRECARRGCPGCRPSGAGPPAPR